MEIFIFRNERGRRVRNSDDDFGIIGTGEHYRFFFLSVGDFFYGQDRLSKWRTQMTFNFLFDACE